MRLPLICMPGLLFLSLLPVVAHGSNPPCSERPREPIPERIMGSTFFNSHPDLQSRAEGLRAWRERRYVQAMRHFRTAAHHADKLSQAMLAQMHWEGLGTPVDHALGYAWMDLAAERGYHNFVQLRELYWSQLTPEEQADAVERGQAIWADKPAQALMAEILWEGKHGQPVDRPAAYAWMDMAAERGDTTLLAQREAYWASLNADEQAQALATGARLYRHYGDSVAYARIQKIQRRMADRMIDRTGGHREPASAVALTRMAPTHSVMPAPAVR